MASTDKMLQAFRAALQEPPSIVEQLQRALRDPEAEAHAIAADYKPSRTRRPPRGQRPDGTPVTATEKRQILAAYEQQLAEQMAELGEQRIPVYASAWAEDPPIPAGHVTPFGW